MIDHIVGAFNMGKSQDFGRVVKNNLTASIFETSDKSTLIDNNSLILIASTEEISNLFIENIFITCLGQITGYLVPIPKSYQTGNLHIILYLYKQYGNTFAKYINGHFVIILWDKNIDQCLLIQDKFPGIKTLYWSLKGGSIFFSNYIKPLLALRPECIHKINKQALYQFLAYSRICAPDTIFEGIWQVCAGEIVELSNKTFTKYVYDPWTFSSEKIIDKDEAIESYSRLLNDSIQSFRDLNPSCGFLLSGGFDSSINVALGAKHTSEPLTTIGVGAAKYNTDAPYARKVSKLYNTNHYEYLVHGPEINELPQIIWQMENPHYDPGVILSYCALKHAKNYVRSVIGGDAADQVFGYTCAISAFKRVRINRNLFGSFRLLHRIVRFFTRNTFTEANPFFSKLENKLIGRYDVNKWAGSFGFRECDLKQIIRKNYYFEERYDILNVPDNDLYELLEFTCTGVVRDYALYGILFKIGRIADLLGIRYFSPYLDKNVFNFVLSLDHSLRTPPISDRPGEFTEKYLHKELAKRLLPSDVINRPKQGGAIHPYIHLEDTNRLKAIKRVILKSEFLNELFYIDRVEKIFDIGKKGSVMIMELLILELWHYIFVERNTLSIPSFKLNDYLENRV